jgi:hypothetical protein
MSSLSDATAGREIPMATTVTAKRKALPQSNTAAVRAMRNHLAGAGFGEGRGGIIVTARDGRVHVGVDRKRFPDAREMRKLIATLDDFTRVRLVAVETGNGAMFDSYVFTRVQPAPDAD